MKFFYWIVSYIVVLTSSALFVSCASSEGVDLNDPSIIIGDGVPFLTQKAYDDAYSQYTQMLNLINDDKVIAVNPLTEEQNVEMEDALNLYAQQGVDSVLFKYSISEDVYLAATYYADHCDEKDVFKSLEENFSNLSQAEIKMAFDIYFYALVIEQQYGSISRAKMTRGCALAIAGVVLSCGAAVTIGSVAGLVYWTICHSVSLASLLDSCSGK